jgi:hypothetical protein
MIRSAVCRLLISPAVLCRPCLRLLTAFRVVCAGPGWPQAPVGPWCAAVSVVAFALSGRLVDAVSYGCLSPLILLGGKCCSTAAGLCACRGLCVCAGVWVWAAGKVPALLVRLGKLHRCVSFEGRTAMPLLWGTWASRGVCVRESAQRATMVHKAWCKLASETQLSQLQGVC